MYQHAQEAFYEGSVGHLGPPSRKGWGRASPLASMTAYPFRVTAVESVADVITCLLRCRDGALDASRGALLMREIFMFSMLAEKIFSQNSSFKEDVATSGCCRCIARALVGSIPMYDEICNWSKHHLRSLHTICMSIDDNPSTPHVGALGIYHVCACTSLLPPAGGWPTSERSGTVELPSVHSGSCSDACSHRGTIITPQSINFPSTQSLNQS